MPAGAGGLPRRPLRDALEIPADPGLTIVTYTLAPSAPHAAAFTRLQEHAEP